MNLPTLMINARQDAPLRSILEAWPWRPCQNA
jgi:hypothetical protein